MLTNKLFPSQLVKVKVVFGPPVQCRVIEPSRTELNTYFVETLQVDMLYMKGERILARVDDITPLDKEEEPADIIDWIVKEEEVSSPWNLELET